MEFHGWFRIDRYMTTCTEETNFLSLEGSIVSIVVEVRTQKNSHCDAIVVILCDFPLAYCLLLYALYVFVCNFHEIPEKPNHQLLKLSWINGIPGTSMTYIILK